MGGCRGRAALQAVRSVHGGRPRVPKDAIGRKRTLVQRGWGEIETDGGAGGADLTWMRTVRTFRLWTRCARRRRRSDAPATRTTVRLEVAAAQTRCRECAVARQTRRTFRRAKLSFFHFFKLNAAILCNSKPNRFNFDRYKIIFAQFCFRQLGL